MHDLKIFIAVILMFLMGIFSLLIIPSEIYGRYVCSNYEDMTGKQTNWVAFDSCYVLTDDGFQRWDEYKSRVTASEGLGK